MKNFHERHGGPDRIVGINNLATETYLKLHKGALVIENNLKPIPNEVPKTPEEESIIFDILSKLPEFIKEYGDFEARFAHNTQIHVLDNTGNKSDKNFENSVAGNYLPFTGEIRIASGLEKLRFAHVLVHELIHLNSFYSIEFQEVDSDENKLPVINRRLGLVVGESTEEDGKAKMAKFHFLNEAVTEELTKRFCSRFFPKIELLREDFTKIKEVHNEADNTRQPLKALLELISAEQTYYAYLNDRFELIGLIEILYERNEDKFDSCEEVFKLFSRAMLNGSLLPLARVIEKTFGKGSFRILGNYFTERSKTLGKIMASTDEGLEPQPKSE